MIYDLHTTPQGREYSVDVRRSVDWYVSLWLSPGHTHRMRDSQLWGRGGVGGHWFAALHFYQYWQPSQPMSSAVDGPGEQQPAEQPQAARPRSRNPASAAEGAFTGIPARYSIGRIIGDLSHRRAALGRPQCRAAAGRPAAGAENCEEPYRLLGASESNSKPRTAFVTSNIVSTRAPVPKQAI